MHQISCLLPTTDYKAAYFIHQISCLLQTHRYIADYFIHQISCLLHTDYLAAYFIHRLLQTIDCIGAYFNPRPQIISLLLHTQPLLRLGSKKDAVDIQV